MRIALLSTLAMALLMPGLARAGLMSSTLTANSPLATEVSGLTGDDRGGIAVSGSKVFITGDVQTALYDKNFGSVDELGVRFDGLISDLHTQAVYNLGTSATTGVTAFGGPLFVTHLLGINGTTGGATGTSP